MIDEETGASGWVCDVRCASARQYKRKREMRGSRLEGDDRDGGETELGVGRLRRNRDGCFCERRGQGQTVEYDHQNIKGTRGMRTEAQRSVDCRSW